MSARDATDGGLSTALMPPAGTTPRRWRRSASKRLISAVRDYAGTGVFLASIAGCVALVVLSR